MFKFLRDDLIINSVLRYFPRLVGAGHMFVSLRILHEERKEWNDYDLNYNELHTLFMYFQY